MHRIPRTDRSNYPSLLREVPGAPIALYAAGRPVEEAPFVAVVGSRRASRYGLEAAAWLAQELAASGVVVVSGMARGIDAAAHRGALVAGGTTVAVLGCGVDVWYPRCNRDLYGAILERGTILSEYAPGTPPLPHHFPVRNRIIAGMCLATVVVEARAGGGALITAKLAADFGREVFAVPGPVNAQGSAGAHSLIREGARLVTCARDVVEDLGLPVVPGAEGGSSGSAAPGQQLAAALAPDERRVLAVLDGHPLLLDSVARHAGIPASSAAAVLARLELKGLACRHPGGRFARVVGI